MTRIGMLNDAGTEYVLPVIQGHTVRAACGCECARVASRGLTRDGQFRVQRDLGFFPCTNQQHEEIAHAAVAEWAGDPEEVEAPDQIIEVFERMLAA
jgi:hypothetical protein